jgi:hypothetical protein
MDLVHFIVVIISSFDPGTKTEIDFWYIVEYSLRVTQKIKNMALETYFDKRNLSVRPGPGLG